MIERTYSAGWGVGEKLTSAQMNANDIAHTYALDKRPGYADQLGSLVQATGSGRIISTIATGPDRDWGFHFGGNGPSATSAQMVRIPTLMSARKYALVNTGATGGDRIHFFYAGSGGTPSGYVDFKIDSFDGAGTTSGIPEVLNAGITIFRLGSTRVGGYSYGAEGHAVDMVFGPSGWQVGGFVAPGMRSLTFLSSTTWTCPPNVYEILVSGYGGGGGGGGGSGGVIASYWWPSGGGGGGGAVETMQRVTVSPGATYTITIGAGGSGGVGASQGYSNAGSATNGAPGGATSLTFGATVLASFLGGNGGGGGCGLYTGSSSPAAIGYARGGNAFPRPTATTPTGGGFMASGTTQALFNRSQGQGGAAVSGPTLIAWALINAGIGYGAANKGYTGGSPGTGLIETSKNYGGYGGGGGAGPGGVGGAGGDGGQGNNGSPGVAGSAGTAAAANTGAGGGGGGGGGCSDFAPADGANGAAGGSGKLTIILL